MARSGQSGQTRSFKASYIDRLIVEAVVGSQIEPARACQGAQTSPNKPDGDSLDGPTAPKSASRLPKECPGGPESRPNRHKTHPRGPKTLPSVPQEDPRGLQERPGRCQESLKRPQEPVKRAQDLPRSSQEAPKDTEDCEDHRSRHIPKALPQVAEKKAGGRR